MSDMLNHKHTNSFFSKIFKTFTKLTRAINLLEEVEKICFN